jgi:hypothetical protein
MSQESRQKKARPKRAWMNCISGSSLGVWTADIDSQD